MFFKNKNKLEKELPDIHKRFQFENKKDYYKLVESFKEKIFIESLRDNSNSVTSYVHFKGIDNKYLNDTYKDNVFEILHNNLVLNLKDPNSIISMLINDLKTNDFYYNQNIYNQISFLKFVVTELYQCINAKYVNTDNIEFKNIVRSLINYNELIEEYEKFTEKKLNNNNVKNFIYENVSRLGLEENFIRIEKEFSYIKHFEGSFDQTLSHKNIEVIGVNDKYNDALFYSISREIIAHRSKKPVLNRNKTLFIFDYYPMNLILSPSIFSQLRALGCYIIIPENYLDFKDEIISANLIEDSI